MNVTQRIDAQAERYPDKIALVFPAGRDACGRTAYTHLTFAQFKQQSEQLACGFAKIGICKGMRTLVFVRPSLEFPLLVFALFKIGAIPVFIDPGMGRKGLAACIRRVAPQALIAEPVIHKLRWFMPKLFRSIKIAVTTGAGRWYEHPASLRNLLTTVHRANVVSADIKPTDPAAIIFTSGATGPAKGVTYTHAIFSYQVETLQAAFQYGPEDCDLAAFPLFALFSIAMGVTAVIPDMDATKPAQADPVKLLTAIRDWGCTTAAGSPAIWERLVRHCHAQNLQLPTIRAVIMFGAPVSNEVHRLFVPVLTNGTTYTPYGATECLPVACIDGRTILNETAGATEAGKGTCIGPSLGAVRVKIVHLNQDHTFVECAVEEIGEIIVSGPPVTTEYFSDPVATQDAKIHHDGVLWHRMGDVGYQDAGGRLWFCGRKAHVVEFGTANARYPIPSEAPFVIHPAVRRAALVGLSKNGIVTPAIVIERHDGRVALGADEAKSFKSELRHLGQRVAHTSDCATFFLSPGFPVDTRHNIKIDRLRLQMQCAEHQLGDPL